MEGMDGGWLGWEGNKVCTLFDASMVSVFRERREGGREGRRQFVLCSGTSYSFFFFFFCQTRNRSLSSRGVFFSFLRATRRVRVCCALSPSAL